MLAHAAAEGQIAARPVEDERFMRGALALGRRHLGRTWPNPSVGALVVRLDEDGPIVVAEGVTQAGGRPHAERVALDAAGPATQGATLYVSLEPCSHHGKTPPCVDAILRSGIARVVTALEDPDPRVRGRGHRLLRENRVAVTTDVLREEAVRAHRGHFLRATLGRPALTLKLAQTADGYAAGAGGTRLYITEERSNARTHLMRAQADAIMVGVGTVLADDPLLTVRLPGLEQRSPLRVILDSRLRTPLSAQIVATIAEVPTWVVTLDEASSDVESRLVDAGAEVIRVRGRDARIDVREALRELARRGITRIFSEGGPSLGEALIAEDLVDEFALATSERVLGAPGVPALGPGLKAALAERFTRIESEQLGPDKLELFERSA
jgi:diaminohydroxyphosphoribosylaminopyrimidine deaminase/5-amino-6-(5-phosphoribosylamino)uracil reductase